MKVYIGKYKHWNWWRRLLYTVFGIEVSTAPTTIVHIDGYDIWNMDHTLSKIIYPMLKRMRADKLGSPFVDNEDVPEEFQVDDDSEDEVNGDKFHERWFWVLHEMIWAFDKIYHDIQSYEVYPDDRDKQKEFEDRMSNGLRLFGKYYRALWT